VASVSCIYGLGSPEAYLGLRVSLRRGQTVERDEILRALAQIQYKRNDLDFHRGTFRARGDVLDVIPAHQEDRALRIELFGDEIENYPRHLRGGKPGDPPPTLLDYFPPDSLIVLDESHQTVPQLNGMYRGDRSRKEVLVDYGFRLPSALDNRPLRFDEFEAKK